MDEKTRDAVLASVEKWKKNRDATDVGDVRYDAGSCPLCRLFYKPSDPTTCDGCPVREKTGRIHCEGSPYVDVTGHHYVCDLEETWWRRYRELCQKEIDFLTSLLPKVRDAEVSGGRTVSFRETEGTWICFRVGASGWVTLAEVFAELASNGVRWGVAGDGCVALDYRGARMVASEGDWICARYDAVGVMVLSNETYSAFVEGA